MRMRRFPGALSDDGSLAGISLSLTFRIRTESVVYTLNVTLPHGIPGRRLLRICPSPGEITGGPRGSAAINLSLAPLQSLRHDANLPGIARHPEQVMERHLARSHFQHSNRVGAEFSLPSASKFEFQIELHAARGLRGDGVTEKWGADDANVGDVILVVQNVKGIKRDCGDWPFLSCLGEREIVCQVEIEIDVGRPVHGVPRNASRTID